MTQNEITKEYTNKVCPYCKAECEKGILVFQDNNTICARCVDYEKDESKIERYKRPLNKTARLQPTVMGLAGPDWN